MRVIMDKHAEVVREFWKIFDAAQYDGIAQFMHPDCNVYWPNTRELLRGRQKLIDVNKRYPGRWRIDIVDIISAADLVISVVRVYSNETKQSFFATSFFKFEEGIISQITEYWGENSEPPPWRIAQGLSLPY
jgi:predicted SnoaL-like aldol condensation-catalyzing enzyme